jgi:hypothetical protein
MACNSTFLLPSQRVGSLTETAGITEAHIKRFQNRARFHFGVSYVILIGILVLFGLAIYVFLFAQEIDKSKGSLEIMQELLIGKTDQALIVQAAQSEADGLLNAFQSSGTVPISRVLNADQILAEATTKLALFDKQIQLMNESGYVANIDRPRSKEELEIVVNGKKQLKDLADKLLTFTQNKFTGGYNVTSADVAEAQRLVNEANLEQQLYQQRASGALPAAQIKQVTTSLDTIELVRTSLVRFGGVAVILFLISLLTPIYRYTVRLGTFYQARADILLLSRDTHLENFSEMSRLFTPVYGFEKEPTTPVESMTSFAKEAAGIIIKK